MAEGDHYQTYKDRLYNGGFDRMGYSQKDADEIRHYLDSGKIFMTDEEAEQLGAMNQGSGYWYGGSIPYPGRIYLARWSFEDPSSDMISGVDRKKYNQDYYREALPTTVAHEVGHYVDNYMYYKPITEGNGKLTNHEYF
jgi:hypothetical protein